MSERVVDCTQEMLDSTIEAEGYALSRPFGGASRERAFTKFNMSLALTYHYTNVNLDKLTLTQIAGRVWKLSLRLALSNL